MAMLIDGKKIAAETRAEIAAAVEEQKAAGVTPGLAVIIVGENPASQVYVRNKHKACGEVGMYSEVIEMSGDTTEEVLLAKIAELNENDKIDGILVQLPLPKHIDEEKVINAIRPDKDVDAFHPVNTGKIMIGNPDFLPCTPAGVMVMLQKTGIDITGKSCVVVGRSNIVGRPMAALLLAADGTVTIAHSRTPDLGAVTRRADILVAAVGKAGLITGDMVKPGAAVIDVGMNRNAEGKLCGDVDFDSVKDVAGYITPVPGGVGPMTVTMLICNTLYAAENAEK